MAFLGTSCEKEDYPALIEGEWHYATDECDIYISFTSEGSFELFQRLGEGRYRLYNGSWRLKEETLSGEYNDGNPWGSSYKVSFEGSDKMTLTANNGSKEAITYTRKSIPEEVLNNSTCEVRSIVEEPGNETPFL